MGEMSYKCTQCREVFLFKILLGYTPQNSYR
uniref:Uncharacterized protein n=1 Tax=Anguilla anguilla TaxID=7936 RepID=A0A0E9VW10_ANGAN